MSTAIFIKLISNAQPQCNITFSYEDQLIDTKSNCKNSKGVPTIVCTNTVNTVPYYYYDNTTNSWDTAKEFCQSKHQHLVSIDSPQDLEAIKKIMKNLKLSNKLDYVSSYIFISPSMNHDLVRLVDFIVSIYLLILLCWAFLGRGNHYPVLLT